MAFFRQHNISTSDQAVKYKSRAAQLYRDKLHQNAAHALRVHGTSKVRKHSRSCTNEEVNFRNALLLRSVFLLVEVGLINKCHLSYKQKLLGTEEYE